MTCFCMEESGKNNFSEIENIDKVDLIKLLASRARLIWINY